MAKKTKKSIEEVVEEVKEKGVEAEVVSEKPVKKTEDKKIIVHWTGQTGYMDDEDNFIPLN